MSEGEQPLSTHLFYLILAEFDSYKGAEPIYLHIIHPLIKPYTSTINLLLDLVCMVRDIFFIAVNVPIDHTIMVEWFTSTLTRPTLSGWARGRICGAQAHIHIAAWRQWQQMPHLRPTLMSLLFTICLKGLKHHTWAYALMERLLGIKTQFLRMQMAVWWRMRKHISIHSLNPLLHWAVLPQSHLHCLVHIHIPPP